MIGDIIVGTASQGHDLLDWATPIFTLLGVLVVGLYTYYAKHQRDEAKQANQLAKDALEASRQSSREALEQTLRSNEIARKALVLGRRAWVVVHREGVEFKGAARLDPDISVENVADMLAIIRWYGADIVVGNLPDDLSVRPEYRVEHGLVLVRGERIPLDLWEIRVEPSEVKLDPLTEGIPAPIFLFFVVEYTDCFDKKWTTEGCWEYDRARELWRATAKTVRHNRLT
jgi:hypothetical protein